MHDMIAITPLGGEKPRVDQIGGLTISEITNIAMASVTARSGQAEVAAQHLERFAGQAAPGPGRLNDGPISAFWTGPNQWMIMASFETNEDICDALIADFQSSASVTEQTDGWCYFSIVGEQVADMFEILCPIPIRRWTGGEATRSSIDHLGCFVLYKAPGDLAVIGPRSSAGSLHHALITAAAAVR